MKLVAIVENVNQDYNRNLVGDIVILDSELCVSGDDKLCYREVEHNRSIANHNVFQLLWNLKHEVDNVEIIGEL
jgi:hypothetical protein